jgi:hypothetical protein
MMALAALVAIPVFAQEDEDNRVYTAPSGKAFVDIFDNIGYGYHFVNSAEYTPAWSGEFFFNILEFGLRPADVLGIDLGIDMFWSNFDSQTSAFTQDNQLINVVDFDHYVSGSIEKKHSGFDVFGLTAPLVVKGIFGKFEIGGGAFASWNIAGSTYCRFRKDNTRAQIEEVKAKVNPFTYGFLATVSYDDFGVYFKYYPKSSKLLPEGSVDLSYMTLGLVLGF